MVSDVAMLPLTVQSFNVIVPFSRYRPAPDRAEFPAMVHSVSVSFAAP